MPSQFRIDGLDDLKAALRRLPHELTAEASEIVIANAQKAKADIIAAYPRRTGNLKNHVSVTTVSSTYSTGAIVKNTAKHAWLFENGTQARHTDIGANRGSMPAGHVFVPIVIRQRRVMYERLRALLVEHGLSVSGQP